MTNQEERAVEGLIRELLPQAAKLAFRLRDFASEHDFDPDPIFQLMGRVMAHAVESPPEIRELSVVNEAQAEALFHADAPRKAHLN